MVSLVNPEPVSSPPLVSTVVCTGGGSIYPGPPGSPGGILGGGINTGSGGGGPPAGPCGRPEPAQSGRLLVSTTVPLPKP